MTLKDRRLAAKMTQQELADKLLVNQTAVSNWEKGINPPLPKYRKQLAKIFGCTEEEITEDFK